MPGSRSSTPTRSSTNPTQRWISRGEVAEIDFTAFSSRKTSEQIPGRLVVRRIPDLNPTSADGQATLFDIWRFHAFFTNHRPRYRHRRQNPPRARHHRAGPHWPQRLRSGPPTFRTFLGQRCLTGPGHHRVQPHPRRCHPHRPGAGHSPHRHHPSHPDQRAGSHRLLRPPPDPAPTTHLALGTGVEHAVQQPVSPKPAHHHLTEQPQPPTRDEIPTGTTRHRDRAINRTHTSDHPGSKPHNQTQLHIDGPIGESRLSLKPWISDSCCRGADFYEIEAAGNGAGSSDPLSCTSFPVVSGWARDGRVGRGGFVHPGRGIAGE